MLDWENSSIMHKALTWTLLEMNTKDEFKPCHPKSVPDLTNVLVDEREIPHESMKVVWEMGLPVIRWRKLQKDYWNLEKLNL